MPLKSRFAVQRSLFSIRPYWVFPCLLGSFGLAFSGTPAGAQSHILVQESEYANWQSLASQPGIWQDMKADAIISSNSLSYDTGISGFGERNYRLRDVASTNALAYILDPANRSTYLQRIRDNLLVGLQDITSTHNGNTAWEYHVPMGGMIYDAILALDVIRYDPGLSTANRNQIESYLDTAVNLVRTSVWHPNGQTVRSMWDLYQGDTSGFLSWKNSHDSGLLSQFTAGGVVIPGPNYAAARLSSVYAQAKSMYLDVLEIQGYQEYYSNPELQNGYEYIYGYSHSPFGRGLTFGDAVDYSVLYAFSSSGLVDNPPILRADRFSEEAGKYAAWQILQGGFTSSPRSPRGRIINYATMTGPTTTEYELAPSRIFDAYAGFIENRQSLNALFGGLLSLTESEAHSHKEANAIALGAYGEHVLRNAGYNGWGNGSGLASWNWINNTAESGNTVIINGANHVSKTSGGIVKGMVGNAVEFARGDSGNALSNGEHLRDMLFIQPGNGAEGYWLIADHVTPITPGQPVQAFWHPNADTLQTLTANQKYLSDVTDGPRNYGTNQVKLTTFLATPPVSTQVKRTTLANRSYSFDADYLAATYHTSTGSADTLTVFFPSDQDHDTGGMARIAYGLYTGATVTQGNVVDTALTSNGNGTGNISGVSFRGEDVVYRTVDNALEWYFVGEGNIFNDGAAQRSGFQSTLDVTVFLDSNQGNIISPGTNITIYEPDLSSILLDAQMVTPIAQGSGWLSFFVPVGSHDLELLSIRPTADFDEDDDVDSFDFLSWQRGFGITTGADLSDGDSNLDGDVDTEDYGRWQSDFGLQNQLAAQNAVPEPDSAFYMLIGLLAALILNDRRYRAHRIHPAHSRRARSTN